MSQASRVPIIRLQGHLLVTIQTALTDGQVLDLRHDVGREIVSGRSETLIIDLTGVDLLDSFIARAIRDLALMVRLMGVETVVSGISPGIASTLVEMGMEMRGVTTARSLEDALLVLQRAEARRREEEGSLASLLGLRVQAPAIDGGSGGETPKG